MCHFFTLLRVARMCVVADFEVDAVCCGVQRAVFLWDEGLAGGVGGAL